MLKGRPVPQLRSYNARAVGGIVGHHSASCGYRDVRETLSRNSRGGGEGDSAKHDRRANGRYIHHTAADHGIGKKRSRISSRPRDGPRKRDRFGSVSAGVVRMSEFLISVILCVRDGEKYLREALDSVANQGVSDLQVIVVDDGSTDDLAKIAGCHCIRPQIVSQPALGLGAALNYGMQVARAARFLAFIDCDERWPRGRLGAMLSEAQIADIDFVYGLVVNTDEELKPIRPPVPARLAGAMLIKRASAQKVGDLRTDIGHAVFCGLVRSRRAARAQISCPRRDRSPAPDSRWKHGRARSAEGSHRPVKRGSGPHQENAPMTISELSKREERLLRAALHPDGAVAAASFEEWASEIGLEEAPYPELRILTAVYAHLSRVAPALACRESFAVKPERPSPRIICLPTGVCPSSRSSANAYRSC